MKLSVEVPFGDLDAMGHLNNVAYFKYLELARQKYWLALIGSRNFRDIGFLVARAEIDFRSSVEMGEVLDLEIRVSRLGNTSFDFRYRITGPDGRVVAEAATVQVLYDWEARRTKPVTDALRRSIAAFEAADPPAAAG